jgi:hypothetical protein
VLLRTFVVLLLAAVLAVWVAPTWSPDDRTLSLRVREAREIRAAARSTARALGERMVRASGDRKRPPVAAAPRANSAPNEKLTDEDREGLDELVEQRLRDH